MIREEIPYNLFHDFIKDHLRHVWLELGKGGYLVYREFFAENRFVVFANLKYLLISHYCTLLDKEGSGNEVKFGLIDASFEREVTYNRHIANHSVVVCGALAPLGFLEIVVGELGYGGEYFDDVGRHGIDVLDLIFVGGLHLFGHEPRYFVLTDELVI